MDRVLSGVKRFRLAGLADVVDGLTAISEAYKRRALRARARQLCHDDLHTATCAHIVKSHVVGTPEGTLLADLASERRWANHYHERMSRYFTALEGIEASTTPDADALRARAAEALRGHDQGPA